MIILVRTSLQSNGINCFPQHCAQYLIHSFRKEGNILALSLRYENSIKSHCGDKTMMLLAHAQADQEAEVRQEVRSIYKIQS